MSGYTVPDAAAVGRRCTYSEEMTLANPPRPVMCGRTAPYGVHRPRCEEHHRKFFSLVPEPVWKHDAEQESRVHGASEQEQA